MVYGSIDDQVDGNTLMLHEDDQYKSSQLKRLLLSRYNNSMNQYGVFMMADFTINNDQGVPPILKDIDATITYFNDVSFAIDFHGKRCLPKVSLFMNKILNKKQKTFLKSPL